MTERNDADCIFCKIARGEIPSEKVYADEAVLAFKDLHPQTETHVLIIPRRHYTDIEDLASRLADGDEDAAADLRALTEAIPKVAEAAGVTDGGYRILSNCGEGAGQSVFHLHVHFLADPTKLQERLV